MDATQEMTSNIPARSIQRPTKPDWLTSVLLSFFRLRVIDVLPFLSFLFLTYNVVDALYKAKGDYKTISFVVFCYADLIALFCCLKSFEMLPEGESPKKTLLKVVIWIFATSLNVSFSYKVTSTMESAVMSTFVWTLAVVTTAGAFYGLFLVSEEKRQSN